MYGSQSELLAQGVDPKQLLGLISHTDAKEEFSINLQEDGTEAFPQLPPPLIHLLLLQAKKLCLALLSVLSAL